MSRHRDVRCMNYSDEYDGYDDVYGHSVEDDYCVSPGAEQFIFDRNKQANIASFFTEPDIVEGNEEEELENVPSSYKLPELSEIDSTKLMSCIEAIREVIGDVYPESELNRKIMEFNFNIEAVLDSILNNKLETIEKEQKSSDKIVETSGCKIRNLSKSNKLIAGKSNVNLKDQGYVNKGCENSKKAQAYLINSDKATRSVNPSATVLSSQVNSLADLTANHLKMTKKSESTSTGFAIPKLKFKPKHSNNDSGEKTSFTSLSELTAHHSKITLENKSSDKKARCEIPNLNPKNSSSSTFNSLADLTAHQLKTFSEDKSKIKNSSPLSSGFVIPKIDLKEPNAQTFNSLADLTAHHLKISNKSPITKVRPLKLNATELPSKEMEAKMDTTSDSHTSQTSFDIKEDITEQDITVDPKSIIEDIRNLDIKEELETKAHKVVKKNFENPDKFCSLTKELKLNNSKLRATKSLRKSVSSFGKVICKQYVRKTAYQRKYIAMETCKSNDIVRFDFSSPSPDSIILKRLRKPIYV